MEENHAVMLTLDALSEAQYARLYALEPEWDSDYTAWRAMMGQPNWANYAVLKDGAFVGALMLERLPDRCCEIHYSTERRRVTRAESVTLLTSLAQPLFTSGIARVQTCIPAGHRAALRLAVACGLIFETFVIRNHQPFMQHRLLQSEWEAR